MTVALSTWSHGIEPNRLSYEILSRGGAALDAVEVGAKYSEADLTCMSVGRGALPDAEGKLTLDASIMNYDGSCGSVAFVQHYLHVITLARRVMEKTPHVMLAGEGAEAFAVSEGFPREELLTDKARALYEQWKAHPNKLNIRLRRAHEGEHEYSGDAPTPRPPAPFAPSLSTGRPKIRACSSTPPQASGKPATPAIAGPPSAATSLAKPGTFPPTPENTRQP